MPFRLKFFPPPLALALALACGSDDSPVTLGVVLDAEGVAAATLAAEHINGAGGVKGRPLRLRVIQGESGSSAPAALAAADSLASDPAVLGVVGHTNSAASLAGAQVYNHRGVVQIAPTSTAPVYSEAGPWSFRLVSADTHQAVFLADKMTERGARRPAVLYVNDDYGRALHAALIAELAVRGINPVYEAAYLEGHRFADGELLVRAITKATPDLLVWLGREPELRQVLPGLRATGADVRVLASDGFSTARLNKPGGESLVGVEYVRLVNPAADSPVRRLIHDRAREVSGTEPTDQAVLAYQAVQVFARAITEAGADRGRIREFLDQASATGFAIEGVSGPVVFDAKGDGKPSYFLSVVDSVAPRRDTPARPDR